MDFDEAKENIQPLASGRNVERLEAALSAESHHEIHELIIEQRREFERAIGSYVGDDPLEIWYEYIEWIEQSYPKSGKETALNDVISTCLSKFENEDRYKQDRRMIKLYIKYIDSEPNPHEFYELMYNNGIGTMIADLYLCWAHYYDYNDNFEKAENVYQKGLNARAQPFDQLEQAHKQFGFSMSQRLLHKDASTREKFLSSMNEQRLALTSLRAHKHRHVGSIRTGAAVKNYNPGRVEQEAHSSRSHSSNRAVPVFEDENRGVNSVMAGLQTPVRGAAGGNEHQLSVVQMIMSSTKKHENLREPGPWSQAKMKTSRSIVGSSVNQKLPFDIMNDDDLIPLSDEQNMFNRGIQLPPGFVTKNLPQAEFKFPLHRDDNDNPKSMAGYNKFMLFPSADKCFSMEELWAYKWWKKRNICNDFTRKQDAIWGCGPDIPIRLPPHFRQRNDKQTDSMELDPFDPTHVVADGIRRFAFNIDHIYNGENEYSMEELLESRWLNGELASQRGIEMELTCGFDRRESVFVSKAHRRSEVLGGRRSILPAATDMPRKSILRKSIAPLPNNSPTYDSSSTTSPTSTEIVDEFTANNKRRSLASASVVDQEMKSPPPSKRKFDEERKFEIFHDDKETAVKEDKGVFKTPNLPPATRPRASSVFELGDDNEGCTTQTFNFFIKSQSVSTPKAIEKVPQHTPCDIQQRCNLFPENETQTPNCTDSELVSAATVRKPFGPRLPLDEVPSPNQPEMEINRHKLSAILETTEDTNTISSAATISSKSSSVDELRTIYETNTNGDSITSSTTVASNKSSPLATIDEIAVMDKSLAPVTVSQTVSPCQNVENVNDETVSTAKIAEAESSVASALPFEIFEDNIAHYIAGLANSKVNHNEPPSMCALNLNEDKTETIPPFLLNRNHTIEVNATAQFAEPTHPFSFAIPPIVETEEQPAAPKTKTSNRSPFAIFEDDTVGVLRPVITDHKPRADETVDRSVFNFGKETSMLPPPRPLMAKLTSNFDVSDSILKLNLSSEPTLPIEELDQKHFVGKRSEFNIFQDFSDKTIAPTIPDAATDMSMNPAIADKLVFEAGDHPLQISKNSEEKATSTSGKTSERVTAEVTPQPTKRDIMADFDEEFYKMIQSPVPKLSTNVVPPKQSLANKTDVRASVANNRSMSLLKPMKEISLSEHKEIDRSTAQSQPPQTTLPQFTFSEDNPNTELFSLHMAAIKNSTLLERAPSPPPSTVVAPPSSAEDHSNGPTNQQMVYQSQDKKVTTMVDEFYATSPVPPSKSMNPIKELTANSPIEKKYSSFDDQFYALINSPIPVAPATSRMMSSLQSNTLFEISGIELSETEMKLMRTDLTGCAANFSFPKFQISEPKTIRPSAFNRMTAHYTIPDSPDNSIHQTEHLHDASNKQSKNVIDDRSVFIVEPTEDLAAIAKQCSQKQSNVNVSDASFHHADQSTSVCAGSVLIDDSESQHVNPFDLKIQSKFLAEIDFVDYINDLDNVYIVNSIDALQPDTAIAFGEKEFKIIKKIGQGSFGFVYSGKCLTTEKMYAFKQERPANLWEFYISLELSSRNIDQNILAGFFVVDFAVIGGNSSVFASEYCSYGSLLDICNKHKQKTFQNLDELIVMIFANQMLKIVDHMHASDIIHADIKPDNFLMMSKLDYGNRERITLKLIDYGQSIDMRFYGKGQTFRTKLQTRNFVCTEMMDDKPWTFQIDLFCVASTIYSMLCGKYMNVEKLPPNSLRAYTIAEPLPTNLHTELWMDVIHTLINVRDCVSMPNLQDVRLIIKEAIQARERFLEEKIDKFNIIVA